MLNLSDVIRPNQTWMAIFCKSGKEELGPVTMVYDIHTKTVFHSCRPESMSSRAPTVHDGKPK